MTLEQVVQYVEGYKFNGSSAEALYIPIDTIPAEKVAELLNKLVQFNTKIIPNHHGFRAVIEVKQ